MSCGMSTGVSVHALVPSDGSDEVAIFPSESAAKQSEDLAQETRLSAIPRAGAGWSSTGAAADHDS